MSEHEHGDRLNESLYHNFTFLFHFQIILVVWLPSHFVLFCFFAPSDVFMSDIEYETCNKPEFFFFSRFYFLLCKND